MTIHSLTEQGLVGEIHSHSSFSEATAREIDLEIRRIINECYHETMELLQTHNQLIHELAEVLLINETIDAEELEIVVECYLRRHPVKQNSNTGSVPERSRDENQEKISEQV